jgi:hypothetical protein
VEGETGIGDGDKAGLLRAVWDTGEAAVGVQIEAVDDFALVGWRQKAFTFACVDRLGRLRGTFGPVPFGVILADNKNNVFRVAVGSELPEVGRVLTVSCGNPTGAAP